MKYFIQAVFLSLIRSIPIIYVPLDERFATRGMFLNMGKQQLTLLSNTAQLLPSEYEVYSPEVDSLSKLKIPANLTSIDDWLDNTLTQNCKRRIFIDQDCIMILSAETFLYGGLINSRISNDSVWEISSRVNKLLKIKQTYSDRLKIYLSQVIMRIPGYSADFEEPWYWAYYGAELFRLSQLYDIQTYNQSGSEEVAILQTKIPFSIQKEFLWRRQRNFNITTMILQQQSLYQIFERMWITLDDSSEFGLNKQEERNLRLLQSILNLTIFMYPGADEVGLVMLANALNTQYNQNPNFQIVYRNPNKKELVPAYEGQTLNQSVQDQILAAGGRLSSQIDKTQNQIVFVVNNFDEIPQLEAFSSQTETNFTQLDEQLRKFDLSSDILIFADVKYSNGGDASLINWLKKFNLSKVAYAGWNTAGNTLGTAVANAVLLKLFRNYERNERFQLYRIIEDYGYQVSARNGLKQFVEKTQDDMYQRYYRSFRNHLNLDQEFYSKFVQKLLKAELYHNCQSFNLGQSYQIENVYFPWHRAFEIGFSICQITMNDYYEK